MFERNKSTPTVRQLERFSMTSTVLRKIKLSVLGNNVNYKIFRKEIKYISIVRAASYK